MSDEQARERSPARAGSPGPGLPLALCFPHDDPVFAERVHTLLDGSHDEAPIAAAVQALLRQTYLQAVISPLTELGTLDRARVWYAFRDGSLVPAATGDGA